MIKQNVGDGLARPDYKSQKKSVSIRFNPHKSFCVIYIFICDIEENRLRRDFKIFNLNSSCNPSLEKRRICNQQNP